ncbi:MAG: twin-arginine translocation signal domain-containing protein, partial [Gemmatimonadaceae bacterium]
MSRSSDSISGSKLCKTAPLDPTQTRPPADDTNPGISPGRREFLAASAAATAVLLGGCLSENHDEPMIGAAAPLSKFDHIVVAMFENRSFDSLIGYAYQPGEPPRNQTYNGLAGWEYRNPVPDYIQDGNAFVSTRVSPGTEADMQNPNPDPGEEYEHVN